MVGVMIFLITFSILCMSCLAPLAQLNNNYDINPDYFRKIKVRRCSYLIKGLGGRNSKFGDAKNYGVIYPMFFIQILGYILSICTFILALILIFALKISIVTVAIISCCILLFHGILCGIVLLICVALTRKKRVGE